MAGEPVFIDTNVLVFASQAARNGASSPVHEAAVRALRSFQSAGTSLWLSRQILREYLVVVTRVQPVGSILPVAQAIADVRRFAQLFEIAEDSSTATAKLLELLQHIPTAGKQIHDANIVATMLANGIRRLLTFNLADFRRFEPLIAIESLP